MSAPLFKTWVEIDRRSIAANVRSFRSILKKKTALYAVVKSNAYGHGLTLFAREAARSRVDGFCVDSVIEGQKLRAIGIHTPILVLGPTLQNLFEGAERNGLTVTVSSRDALRALRRSKNVPEFHVKFDTGMHRQGFFVHDAARVARFITSSPKLLSRVRGVYTHFAAAKDATYPTFTNQQLDYLLSVAKVFRKNGIRKCAVHSAATGGATMFPRSQLDVVRIGIGLYGYWPSPETLVQHPRVLGRELSLAPVLSWKAIVSEVKRLRKGDYVGYDFTERLARDTTALVIPIGYWHGYPRSLSNIGEVLLRGARAKVLGRVSMDSLVVGLPRGIRALPGDVVTLIGSNGGDRIDAAGLGMRGGIIHYELLTRLNPLIERVLV